VTSLERINELAARWFRDHPGDQTGKCGMASAWLYMNSMGDLEPVSGWFGIMRQPHNWNVGPDETIYDLTASQFLAEGEPRLYVFEPGHPFYEQATPEDLAVL